VYDTYLSPLDYSGIGVSLVHENMKMISYDGTPLAIQHFFNFDFSFTKNPTKTAETYTGILGYDFGMYYRFSPHPHWMLFAGGQAEISLGAIYNQHNGNNPVSMKQNLNINAAGMAVYQFAIKKQTVRLRYQLSIPFLGYVFSPKFGQPYYDMSADANVGYMYLSSFHNQRTALNMLSVELPLGTTTLRVAYQNRYYETQINELDTRLISNIFYIGFSQNIYVVPDKKTKNYRHVFE